MQAGNHKPKRAEGHHHPAQLPSGLGRGDWEILNGVLGGRNAQLVAGVCGQGEWDLEEEFQEAGNTDGSGFRAELNAD